MIVVTAALAALVVLNVQGRARAASSDDLQLTLDHLDAAAAYTEELQNNLGDLVQFISSGNAQLLVNNSNVESFKNAAKAGFVNNLNEPEDSISQMAGMTHSETSNAWCGDNAVIGFNDSGSFVKTVITSGSYSFNGWAVSNDGGKHFVDRGALMSGSLPPGVVFRDLLGDPGVGCTSPSTFYYSSIANEYRSGGPFTAFSGVSVSPSYDGGQNFGTAVMASEKPAAFHELDKPWMAVSPAGFGASDVIHVTYTDFDFSGSTPPCVGAIRTAIEYVRSVDGGYTWSAPQTIDQVCGGVPFVQGSQVRVGTGSDLFVAWERYPTSIAGHRQIMIRKSSDMGATFGPAVMVSDVTPTGTGQLLRGRFRTFIDLQGLAVDTSSPSNGPGNSKKNGQSGSGNVYITFHDGGNLKKPDPYSGCEGRPQYCFSDVLFTSSTDGGQTWSPPTRISQDPVAAVDRFFPTITVDPKGDLFVLYYDRGLDPRNLLIDAVLAKSKDQGQTWDNSRLTTSSFPPITGFQDQVVNSTYMGDYIGVAADSTGVRPGVISSWGDNSLGNQNVSFIGK
jgi:hypothetical protein